MPPGHRPRAVWIFLQRNGPLGWSDGPTMRRNASAPICFPRKASRLVKSAGTTTARKSARSSMRPTVARDMAWRGFGYWRRWPSVTRKYPVCATILRPAASLPCASIKRPGLKLPEKRTDCSLCVCPVNNGCAGLVLHEHSGTSNMQFICFPLVSIWADRGAVIRRY